MKCILGILQLNVGNTIQKPEWAELCKPDEVTTKLNYIGLRSNIRRVNIGRKSLSPPSFYDRETTGQGQLRDKNGVGKEGKK